MKALIYIGTSGWHYDDWNQSFYPPEIKGYEELRYHSTRFNTVENNSSEFRNKYWFTENIYELLKTHNIALVAAQSSRYPSVQKVTADFAYIRFHGPGKLFASSYTKEQLQEWANYIQQISNGTKSVYVYFNNDYHVYAIDNAKTLKSILKL